jgi:hypothetical protein
MRALERSRGRALLAAIAFAALASTLGSLVARGQTGCPNDCSGRGLCLAVNAGLPACHCDPGYMGRDCSVAQCCVADDCDDGDPFTADHCDMPSGACDNPPEVAAIRCYPARARKGSDRFEKLGLEVADAIEAKNSTAQKPSLVCDFVAVDGGPLVNATAGFECFKLNDLKGQPKFQGFELNATTALFGKQELIVQARGKQLCLPTPLLEPGSCPAGRAPVPSPDGPTCMPCSPGSHQPIAGGGACVACPLGTAADQVGAARCRRCAPGFFANATGAEHCTPCAPGFFVNVTGAPACAPCPAGTFAPLAGRSVCRLCPPGLQPTADRTGCTP